MAPLDVDGAVDANAGVDIGKLRDASQETATVLVDVLLARLEIPFAVANAGAAGERQTWNRRRPHVRMSRFVTKEKGSFYLSNAPSSMVDLGPQGHSPLQRIGAKWHFARHRLA